MDPRSPVPVPGLADDPSPGRTVGRWRLCRPLGAGQFGTTWLAEDPSGKQAAVKLMAEPPGAEALALARIAHPGVPRLLDSGGAPEPYLAMELVQGESLDRALGRQQVAAGARVTLMGHLFEALAVVHHAGIVHGDVKPENLCSRTDASLALLDFGMVGQSGGTRDYAAPERLGGGPATAAADVYAAALIWWELVHGELPDADMDTASRLRARLERAPTPTGGSGWERDLLASLLACDPEARPTAAAVVDVLAARGFAPTLPDAALLNRRLASATVGRGAVDQAVARWESQGGSLAVRAAAALGRSHQLRSCATRLAAAGVPYVLVAPTSREWGAIEAALHSPTLGGSPRPLPTASDPLERSEAAIDALVARGGRRMRVLVDDYDELDSGSRTVVQALIRRGGVPVLLTSTGPSPADVDTVELLRLDRPAVRTLVRSLLSGDGDLEAFVDAVLEVSGGRPGAVVDLVRFAIESGILMRPTWRWACDQGRLTELADADWTGAEIPLGRFGTEVGATLALSEDALPLAGLAGLTGLDVDRVRQGLAELDAAGVVQVDRSTVRLDSIATARRLADRHPDPQAAHARIHRYLVADQDSDMVRCTWHAAMAGLTAYTAGNLEAAMSEAAHRGGSTAVRLGAAVHACLGSELATELYARALVQDGRGEDAIAVAREWIARADDGEPCVGVRLVLAKALGAFGERRGEARAVLAVAESRCRGPVPLRLVVAGAQLAFHDGAFDEVLALADHEGDDGPLGGEVLTLRLLRAQSLHALGRSEDALTLLDVDSERLSDPTDLALLLGVRGRLLWHLGRVRQAARVLDAAAKLPVGAVTRARMANNAALALYQSGDVPRAVDAWERAIALFERLELHTDLVRALTNVVIGYRDAGRWARAVEAGEAAHRMAEVQHLPDLRAMCLGNLGDVALARGEFERAEALYDRCAAVATEHDLAGERVELQRRRAELAVLRGDAHARAAAAEAENAADEAGMPGEALRARVLGALCDARAGQAQAARRSLEGALATLKANGAARELAEVRVWAAEAWLALGDRETCIEELDRALAYADEAGVVSLRARGDAIRARVRPSRTEAEESELERFMAATAHLARRQDTESLFDAAARAVRELVGTERAFVIRRDEDGFAVAAYSGPVGEGDSEPSRTVVGRTLRSGRPVVVTDLGEREDLRAAESIMALDLRFAACVPVRTDGQVVGALYCDGPLIVERGLDRVTRVLSFLSDHVSAALENVRAQRAARARAEEISEVGHDLRGMLLVIEANVHDVLLDAMTAGDREQVRALQDVLLATDRVQRLSDGLVRRYRARSQQVDLTALVDELLRWSAADARHRSVALNPDLDGPVTVEGDPDELNRAVSNLLSNAIQHAECGGLVQVALRVEDGDAVLAVRNGGEALDPERLGSLFEPGVRGKDSSGHGLGLSIVRKIARAHGGVVRARNHPDGGVEFSLRLRAS